MSDFDSEYQALHDWYEEKLDDAQKLPQDGVGLDGCSERSRQEMQIDKEYRQRLLVLRQKYEADKSALAPVEKARTFAQALQATGA